MVRKKTKTNQEEAGNECNSCITSNTPSSKLHNIKNQAQSEFSTSKTSQQRGDTAESTEPCPHSEAQHAPSLLFILILCRPLQSSLGYLLLQSNTILWVRGEPGGNTHNDPPKSELTEHRGPSTKMASDHMHIYCISVCVEGYNGKDTGCNALASFCF